MKILSNKSGIGLSIVLPIIIFIISSTVIAITLVYGTSMIVEGDFKANQEYVNAQKLVDTAANIIIRDEDLTPSYLNDLSDYLGITITEYTDGIYLISKGLSTERVVSSYITTTASGVTTINMGDMYFDQTGIESGYEHNALLKPAVILSSFLASYMPETFPSLGYNESFDNFDDIFNYIKGLADDGSTYTEVQAKTLEDMRYPTVGGHWYINDDVKIDDNDSLIIPEGYVLFIDGNLELGTRSLLQGIVVVNGRVKFDTNKTYGDLEATVYCSGDFIAETTLYLGYWYRPSFVFADGKIDLQKYVYYYGYFYSAESFEVNRTGTYIYILGGVYSPDNSNLDTNEVYVNNYLDVDDLYDMGVSNIISIIDESNASEGFIYTSPK
jgi:hypothetical protein